MWAGISSVTWGLLKNDINISWLCSGFIAGILFVVFCCCWMSGLKRAHAINKRYYEKCSDSLIELLRNENAKLEIPAYTVFKWEVWPDGWCKEQLKIKWHTYFDWSSVFELSITLFMLTVGIWVLNP